MQFRVGDKVRRVRDSQNGWWERRCYDRDEDAGCVLTIKEIDDVHLYFNEFGILGAYIYKFELADKFSQKYIDRMNHGFVQVPEKSS